MPSSGVPGPEDRSAVEILRRDLSGGADATTALEGLRRGSPAAARAVFLAVARRRFGAVPPLAEIGAFAAATYRDSPVPYLGQRGLEAVLRGALGEPELSEHLTGQAAYAAAVTTICAAIVNGERRRPGFLEGVAREAGALLDMDESQWAPPQGPHQYRVVPSFAAQPRWSVDGRPTRTVAGAWLKALALRRRDEQTALWERTQWRGNERLFLHFAFVFAMRGYFTSILDLRETTDFAAEIRARFMLETPALIDIEALVREALNDKTASVAGISGMDSFRVFGLGAGLVLWKIDAPPEAIDTLIARAEDITIEQGWQPVLL